jgi:Patatin-like phospholipase
MGGGSMSKFFEVFAKEVAAISKRREKHGRPPIVLETESTPPGGPPVLRPTPASNVVGLALSGGGIRSAALCLGAMQALDYRGLIDKIDYLSTVSGGGYIGTSMTAAMATGSAGKFPFASELQQGEVPGVQHIRDHSNYLFPQGPLNIFSNVVVYLRGLVANAVLLLPYLLLMASFTLHSNPDVASLKIANFGGFTFEGLPISVSHFGLTLNLLLFFVIFLAGWALWRSTPRGRNFSDVGFWVQIVGFLLVVILFLAFLELQPLLLDGMFSLAHNANSESGRLSRAASWLKTLAAVLAPVATVLGFFSQFLAERLKRSVEKPGGFWAFAEKIAVKFAMYLAGAAVPLVLWVAYLYLAFWGIKDCTAPSCSYAPAWLTKLAGYTPYGSILCLYVIAGVTLLIIGWLLSPNSNSLHRLYRDRLSKAFLFDPSKRVAAGMIARVRGITGAEAEPSLHNSDLEPLSKLKVSELNTDQAPYQLINTALNIEASKYANRRGRNADFFMFSPLFTGSEATGYVDTKQMEAKVSGLTAGTAMAVSGAAASADMGSATIRPLVPTLAILNVRLGYWLINPSKVAGTLKKSLFARFVDRLYFAKELLGLLTEDSEIIYLTDGGHIENLGIYELLRRRCKLIIAVDGEADPEMSFGSLVTLERYARIDFGLRIGLPWAKLRDVTREASDEVRKGGGKPPSEAPHGPHCALGTIYYPRKTPHESESDSTGVLLYIKSSFTGDENDYVVDYKRRNPDFPHETTLDQLFTEEQFEVYRDLGFHAVNSAFNGSDDVSMEPKPAKWQGSSSSLALEIRMRQILGLPVTPPPAPRAVPVAE